jgi:hypothetical protein
MKKNNLHEMFESRMNELAAKCTTELVGPIIVKQDKREYGLHERGFKMGYAAALRDLQCKVDGLVEALEQCESELLTIDDHVNYGKMERYYTQERSFELNKLIHKIQQALAEFKKGFEE